MAVADMGRPRQAASVGILALAYALGVTGTLWDWHDVCR